MAKISTQLMGGLRDAANVRNVVAFLVTSLIVGVLAGFYVNSDLPGSEQARSWLPFSL